MTRKQKGFTLIELLIVVAIIGILAAIAIPNLLTAMQRSKQKRTMADIRSIATAWEARATDMNKYNAAGAIIAGGGTVSSTNLTAGLSPTYIKQLPAKDGWENGYTFEADQAWGALLSAQNYGVASSGRDGVLTATNATFGGTKAFDCDIVFSNGSFTHYPEGIQSQ